MLALVLAATMIYIMESDSIRPVQPPRFICYTDHILYLSWLDKWFLKRITPDTGFPSKNVNKPDHFPSTTITRPLLRMDAESVAAVTGCTEELHVVMVYHCSVSVWMREHAISTTGSSMLVSPIMGKSMDTGLQDSRARKQGIESINDVHLRVWDGMSVNVRCTLSVMLLKMHIFT